VNFGKVKADSPPTGRVFTLTCQAMNGGGPASIKSGSINVGFSELTPAIRSLFLHQSLVKKCGRTKIKAHTYNELPLVKSTCNQFEEVFLLFYSLHLNKYKTITYIAGSAHDETGNPGLYHAQTSCSRSGKL
jgi:hypothetical protein